MYFDEILDNIFKYIIFVDTVKLVFIFSNQKESSHDEKNVDEF